MSPRPLALAPPPLPADARALAWVLACAFGPPESAPGAVDGASAVRLASALDLAARIASRCPRARLAEQAGEAAAEELHRQRTRCAGEGLRLAELQREVAGVAARAGLELAWLKFAALEATGLDLVGRRTASDLDLLVRPADAPELARALAGRGFAAGRAPAPTHHLRPLVHARLGALEIHDRIPGVRLSGRRSAGYAELAAAGLLRPARDARASVPVREVLVAHALVHGLAQHARAPHGYPLWRLPADLLDLGVDGPHALAGGPVAGWIAGEVAAADLAAMLDLLAALAAGTALAGADAGRPGLWLRHLVAGTLDADYRAALRARAVLVTEPADLPRPLRGALALWRAVALAPAQVEAIYGPQRGRMAVLGRQLLRPFDLVGRGLAALGAGRRLRRRSG